MYGHGIPARAVREERRQPEPPHGIGLHWPPDGGYFLMTTSTLNPSRSSRSGFGAVSSTS